MTTVFLHRNDLRMEDNSGLARAGEDSAVPVYAIDPEFWEYYGHNRKAYILQNLRDLQERYRQRGSDIYIRHGHAQDVVQRALEEFGSSAVYYNKHYSPRQTRIESRIEELPVETQGFRDRVAVDPRDMEKEYGTMSQFYSEWKKHDKPRVRDEPGSLEQFTDRRFDPDTFDVEATAEMPPIGHSAAMDRWTDFRDNRLSSYMKKRDEVADPEGVSRIGFFLSNGVLGVREVLQDVLDIMDEAERSTVIRNAAKFRYEMAWREFMYQVLWHNPRTVEENYREFPNEIQWRDDSSEIEAWKRGETGVPFVDAGIRQMLSEGYMHNRTRQNVASFFTKHLMADWRKGEQHFREHLFDHDTANNVGGWQWSASTGTDSVPVRIFNPVKQGRKYDPGAEYIVRHVEELEPLNPEQIHSWVGMEEQEREELRRKYGIDYPSPVIDFHSRYHEGKEMFENAMES
jgi:deoxyribodipyrimidine photo-lyase